MTLDPITLWIYRGVLGAVALACLAIAIYALSRAGSSTGVQGLDSIVSWLSGKKTYFIAAAVPVLMALNAYDYLSDATTNMLLMLLGAGGLATLRAGQAKAEQSAQTAATAAKVSAVKVEEAVSAVVAKVEAVPAIPKVVEPPVIISPAPPVWPPPPTGPGMTRVPREQDLPGGEGSPVRL